MIATLLLIVCTAPWSSVDAIPAGASTPPVGLRQRVEQDPSTEDQGAVHGTASWYATTGLTAAAGPALRRWLGPDWRGQHVRVCGKVSCIVVKLTDACQCYRGERRERALDLSDSAFQRLAPLAVGLVRVTVSLPVPPATDAD